MFEETGCADETTAVYRPTEEDFQPLYKKDKGNQKRQSWKTYWSWVESFYDGNALDVGWTKRSQALIDSVKDEKAKEELRSELNSLGRIIAAEWAKDNSVRKVDTADLRSFANRLLAAKTKDNGTGKGIKAEIRAVRKQVERKIGTP